jgi:hypothetical protein
VGIINKELTVVTCSRSDFNGLSITLKSLTSFYSDMPRVVLVLSEYSQDEIDLINSEFAVLNPDVYQIDPNGIYNAQNFGLNKVNTRLMLILNGGDSLLAQAALQLLVQKLGSGDWGYGACRFVDPISGDSRVYQFSKYSQVLHRVGLKFVPHPSVVVDVSKAREFGGFDLEYKIAADQKMLLQFAKNSEPITIADTISSFELGGASSRKSSEIVNDFSNISHEIFGYFFHSKKIDKIIWKIVLILRKNLGS